MSTEEYKERWRDLPDTAARLKWARSYWQMRAGAVAGTAQDAAASLGMKGNTYRTYERQGSSKDTPLNHQLAVRFGRRFNVNWVWLLLGEGSPFDELLPKAQERAVRAMDALDEADQQVLADMIERWAQTKKAG